MAHYADLLHAQPGPIGADACTQDEALAALVSAAEADDEAELLAGLTPRGQELALSLSISMAARAAGWPPVADEAVAAQRPGQGQQRRLLLRQLLQQLSPTPTATSSL
jgi:hypothetical protein